jgi:hypothetical protein
MSISSFTEGRRYERPGKSKEPAGRRRYNSWENGEEKEAGGSGGRGGNFGGAAPGVRHGRLRPYEEMSDFASY